MKGKHIQLKLLRAKNSLSQQDMADLLGMAINSYNHKENNVKDFTISEIEKIKEIFGLPYEDIFFGEYAHVPSKKDY